MGARMKLEGTVLSPFLNFRGSSIVSRSFSSAESGAYPIIRSIIAWTRPPSDEVAESFRFIMTGEP